MHPSPLAVPAIEAFLLTESLGRRIHVHERLDSTNREAMAMAQAGAGHGTLVLADGQTAGKGRMARTWFSPPGLNIYASVIIRVPMEPSRMAVWLSWLPLMAALGVAEAIETVADARVAVKWPNDLLIGERKLAGILCESGTSPGVGAFQVIGMGINVNGMRTDFPEELQESATSIRQETGGLIDRNRLVAQLLTGLESRMKELLSAGREPLARAYRRRCATIGRTVKALLADGNECIGTAEAIAEDGSLTLVQTSASGTNQAPVVRQLRAADIVHVR
ncbi:MAG TPA: biotin--[acetyl-CoA-carboxylase] ligase [Nitrospira sp.]|nr:biotin--[acetyl-CoA-carboxylase] ligase [Nitrospira sp.]